MTLLQLFGWRDGIEILFFSVVFYYFSLWLSCDTQKNLLGYLYSYCAVAFISYHLQLTGIITFLWVFTPIACVFLLLFHQDFLQRNFITLRKISQPCTNNNWIEQLTRASLKALHNNKVLYILIERTNDLRSLLDVPLSMNSTVSSDLLDLIIYNKTFDESKMIWLDSTGLLRGVNTSWNQQVISFSQTDANMPSWIQNGLLITHKNDCLIVSVSHKTQSFTIIVNGKLYQDLNSQHALSLLKKYTLQRNQSEPGDQYDKNTSNYFNKRSS